MTTITSRENDAVKEFCKLSSSKKRRDETGCFALESMKLVLEAYENGVSIEKVFLTDTALQKYREKLFELLNSGVRICIISDEVSRKMTLTDSPQGIFAVCKKLDKSFPADKIKHMGVYAALCGLQDPGNIGTILRTAEAFGVRGVIVSTSCCDLYNPKVLRASMGTVFRLPVWVSADFCGTLKSFSAAGMPTYAAVVNESVQSLTDIDFGGKGVAVIGNEGNGLPQEVADCCDVQMTIRMAGKTESLNAAMAAGIILWEMTR